VLLALWVRFPIIPYASSGSRASESTAAGAARAAGDAEIRRRATTSLATTIAREERALGAAAQQALSAPSAVDKAFDYLRALPLAPASGVVLLENDVPVAWSGQLKADPRVFTAPLAVLRSPFYTTLGAGASREFRRAVAMTVIHAEPPSDRFTPALDEDLTASEPISAFTYYAGSDSAGAVILRVGGVVLLRADATPLPSEMAQFGRISDMRAAGTVLLALLLIVFVAASWRDRKRPLVRFAAVAISLAAVGIAPWSAISNSARAFDPAFYYSPLAGPFTSNAGALLFTGILLLLATYALVRYRRVRLPRPLAAILAILSAVAGFILTIAAADGIQHPLWGSTASLWLIWEVPLFLILFSFWLLALWLSALSMGMRGGANVRASAAVALLAGAVAVALVWRTTIRERQALAATDIATLQQPDGEAATLLARFGAQLTVYDSAGTRADLLKRYASSDLASAALPVSLAAWDKGASSFAELRLAPMNVDSTMLASLVASAMDSARPLMRQAVGTNGRQVMMAVPHRDSSATSVVASPRTQLVGRDPFSTLLGFPSPVATDPPYNLTLSDVPPDAGMQASAIAWRHIGNEIHGDQLIETSRGLARAHAEVDLRSWPARFERGLLLAVLDAAVAALLWALAASAEGGFIRFARFRAKRWATSYRGRLTLALFMFFVVPALAFSVWSYQRLRRDDRDVRELLVRETLHSVTETGDLSAIDSSARASATPIFLFAGGLLSRASDGLLDELAPAGRALPSPVYITIAARGELTASWQANRAQTPVLFGYTAAAGPGDERYVLAAPARSDELILDRRRRDLAVLVLFATVLGGVAALWLSGIAAKRLARDLELSRVEVARAERVLAWGEMARQIAHEIKNPLTPIRLGVQHLKRARTDRRVDFDRVLDENVGRILAEIDRLDEIARAFTRYGSAPSELPPAETIDAAAILRDVVALERMGVGDIRWTLSGVDEPALARARTDELRDVLLNVFENARLARARNVAVSLRRGARTVCIDVVDDGAGITTTTLSRVFEPHFSTRTTGSGFGLAISRRLLDSWGGAIDITSEEGKGARVTLTLQAA
jgi:two-component system nitrogen regulation sensor histidine kinase NtrY